ncbi:MAG: fumarylacetoacetate hydrolase family protein [Verrucomicrobiota bacterium]|nr:fumarylacetoacetate hydrolase family protein [Verrucomicrobiota bacterium]
MKLYTFYHAERKHLGIGVRSSIVHLPLAYAVMRSVRGVTENAPVSLPNDMLAFIRMGETGSKAAEEVVSFMKRRPALPVGEQIIFGFDDVKLCAPILKSGKIICARFSENKNSPEAFFSKFPSCLLGPNEPILQPAHVSQLSCQPVVAVVIGKLIPRGKIEDISQGIFGYTLLKDISVANGTLDLLSGNFDTFCPLGPCVHVTEGLAEIEKIQARFLINGDEIVLSPISGVFGILARLVETMTLEPGDVIGIAAKSREGSCFVLKTGDVTMLEADDLGKLENRVIQTA